MITEIKISQFVWGCWTSRGRRNVVNERGPGGNAGRRLVERCGARDGREILIYATECRARPPPAAAAENEPDNNLFSPEDVESERVSVLFSCRALELPVMAEALLYPAWETMLIKKNNEGNERLGRLWINARIYYRRTFGRERARRGVGVPPRGRARILFNYALQMDRGHARHPLMTRRIVNYCQ